jgi:hypothetical protein
LIILKCINFVRFKKYIKFDFEAKWMKMVVFWVVAQYRLGISMYSGHNIIANFTKREEVKMEGTGCSK